jgi:hypothetical protein
MPRRFSSIDRPQSSLITILTGVCTQQESGILLRSLSRVVQHFDVARDQIVRDVLERIVAQADLHGLIEEEHVDFVVPGVFAEVS